VVTLGAYRDQAARLRELSRLEIPKRLRERLLGVVRECDELADTIDRGLTVG
jgi:hypothetical protein